MGAGPGTTSWETLAVHVHKWAGAGGGAGVPPERREGRTCVEHLAASAIPRTPPLLQAQKEKATHSRVLTWEISWTEEPGWLQSVGSQKSQL